MMRTDRPRARSTSFFFKRRSVAVIVVLLFMGSCLLPVATPHNDEGALGMLSFDGHLLYAPMWTTTTYMIDSSGNVNHSWPDGYLPGVAVWWLGDGAILRTIRVGSGGGAGGAGGGVQKIESDGTVVWDFRYNSNGDLSHHDVKTLPNGNVLLIAWETKTRTEAIAAGRNPSYVNTQGLSPDHIIEVHPTGPTSGNIVWEWHVWDHLIQNYDSSKANYGVIANHPELVNINYVTSSGTDLMHTNSIDYNEQFDQILISVHNYNEIWVIDHSTTTAEAAGHTGGRYGHGGDLLYRWGNPQVYGAGSSSDEKLFSQHDASWIKSGFSGAGDILVFNNGANRPGSHYSTVDEVVPPVDENGVYYLEPGSAYGPASQTWEYIASPPTSFYVSHLSGAQRLPNGDTLICNGETGLMFEVTPGGSTVWQYNSGGQVFKAEYIPSEPPAPPPGNTTVPNLDCTGSLSWSSIKPGGIVHGSFQVQNIGDAGSLLNWTVNNTLTWGDWTFAPSSGEDLTPEQGPVTVDVTVVAPNEKSTLFEGYLQVQNKNNASDVDTIPVSLKTAASTLLSTANPFITMVLRWLSTFMRYSGRMSMFVALSLGLVQQMFHNP
jgi:hypothetical protein